VPVHTIVRTTKAGRKRYYVRASIGGRAGRLLHLGVFRTRVEADECERWAALELAAGRIPNRRAKLRAATTNLRTLREAARQWVATRVDLAEQTRDTYAAYIQRGREALWQLPVNRVTIDDVQTYITTMSAAGHSPASIRRYLSVIKQTLDYAGIEPNPARDRKLRLPREDRVVPDPPGVDHVAAIIEHASPKRYKLPIALLEATGLRVTELCSLAWGDVDEASSRLRIASGKTRSARRFVPVPPELMQLVSALCVVEDRHATRRVFAGIDRVGVQNAMARACRNAGIPRYSPHDLRHRYISRLVQRGVPITQVQALAGHSRASLTVDVYGHVLVDTDEAWRRAELWMGSG
jgi:integrase